jgi:hypothetical protein
MLISFQGSGPRANENLYESISGVFGDSKEDVLPGLKRSANFAHIYANLYVLIA